MNFKTIKRKNKQIKLLLCRKAAKMAEVKQEKAIKQAPGEFEDSEVDEETGDDEDDELEEEEEEEEDDEGYDEEGPQGKWVKPKNRGASVWLTVKKEMCRAVHHDGTYMV